MLGRIFRKLRFLRKTLRLEGHTPGVPGDQEGVPKFPLKRVEEALKAEFDPAFYLTHYPDIEEAGVDPLHHYIAQGWREGRWPNIWFDPAQYFYENPDIDPERINPFLHYLGQSLTQDNKIKATPTVADGALALKPQISDGNGPAIVVKMEPPKPADILVARTAFNSDYYLKQNPDVEKWGGDPLVHFLTLGWIEGRDPSPDFSLGYYIRNNRDMQNLKVNPFLHYLRHGKNEKWRQSASVSDAVVLDLFQKNPAMIRRVEQACALEPMVALPTEHRRVTSPVKSTQKLTDVIRGLREVLGTQPYRYIITVPHIRMSGATRLGAILSEVMTGITDPESILVVTTDSAEDEYAHWFPPNVKQLRLWDYISDQTADARATCLFDLLRGTGCETLINVNSRLAWEMMCIYGRQVSQEFQIVTYLFTWDMTVAGARVGYPIQWLRDTADFHHLLLTDNRNLADDIRQRLSYEEDGRETEVVTLYTPADEPKAVAMTSLGADGDSGEQAAPRVLWAGRFDRQKRVDVLVKIARDNPHIQFDVYGKKVLDTKDLKDFNPPDNINEMGTYKDLANVLETPYVAYLYTSQWDGVPTILLDIGQAGLPIVASNVGGVSELIDEQSGWLIDDFENPEDYSKALKAILANPVGAAGRVANLKTRIATQFSRDQYETALREVFQRHGI